MAVEREDGAGDVGGGQEAIGGVTRTASVYEWLGEYSSFVLCQLVVEEIREG